MANKKMNAANPKRKPKKNIFHRILIVMIAGILLFGVSGFFMLSTIVGKVIFDDPSAKIKNEEPSPVYASDGVTKIGEFGGVSRENVTYNQIPQSVIDAFLSIEDSRYYKHNGFDLPRFISSALTNLRSGSFAQGGSTLTMQLIDNTQNAKVEDKSGTLSDTKELNPIEKVEQKIQEIYLSMKLETDWTKEEILTKYLNEINFGSSSRGIQKGAQYYFNKDVSQLNLSESAFLAGVINAPNYFNPYNGGDYYTRAINRRNKTLDMMEYHGFITSSECALAKSTELAFQMKDGSTTTGNDKYKNALYEIQQEVSRTTKKDPATTPMAIYTSIDVTIQDSANALSAGEGSNLPDNKYYQMGTTLLNNSNGEIVAVIGGRSDTETSASDFKNRFNDAFQIGSTSKPILDYVKAFDDLGWCTSRVMSDKEKFKVDSNLSIGNASGQFNGDVSLEKAIAMSLNTIALQTMQAYIEEKGDSSMISYLKDLGLSDTTAEAFNILYGIGGSTLQFSPTQLAAAYAALGNGGYYIEPHMVRKVVLKDTGTTIETKAEKKQVVSEAAAFMISDLLYKSVNGKYKGENLMGSLGFGAYPVYGKTGTTNYDSDYAIAEYQGLMKDEWMVNYTSEYTVATWTGFDNAIAGANTKINDYLFNNVNGYINKKLLDTATTDNVKKIAKPSGVSEYGGGYIKTEYLKDAAKINPKTEINTNIDTDPLKELIDSANKMNKNDYTEESYQALQDAIKEAKKVLDNEDATQEEVSKALSALQNAINALVKKEADVDFTKLKELINTSQTYIDYTKYNADKVKALEAAISAGITVSSNDKSTQAEIDAAIVAINTAVDDCVKNPINNNGGNTGGDSENPGTETPTTPPVTPTP
ncbi:transglycosylase domain-containing protein [Amedibacillus sp. YH-ame6]